MSGTDFVCPDPSCSDLTVVMGEEEDNKIYIQAELVDSATVKFLVPKYTKPEVLRVELTLNGKDYTNDNKTYGFFDPYVLDVQPRLIHTDGSTIVTISGFGFVDSNEIKTKFVAAQNESA